MKCSVPAYEGLEPYIFVSYCHEDQARVYPLIEMMARDGYRIWYDEGIIPGDEWTETIAQHLEGCRAFVAFVTEASLNSHNCRREINFAIQRDKHMVCLYLDEVKLSAGMEMLLSSVQGIFARKYLGAEEMLGKLFEDGALEPCKGEERPDILPLSRLTDEDRTVTMTQNPFDLPQISRQTWLMRVSNLEKVFIRKSLFSIGRSENHADYVIQGNSAISRRHIVIRKNRAAYTMIDNNSLNHVILNGQMITPLVEYEMRSFDVIALAREFFVFFRNYEEEALEQAPRYVLRGRSSSYEIPCLPVVRIGSGAAGNEVQSGSGAAGPEIGIPSEGVAESHAFFVRSRDELFLVDTSMTGQTWASGKRLMFGEKRQVYPGDLIGIGSEEFELAVNE